MTKKEKKIKVANPTIIKEVNDDTNQVKTFIYILIGIAIVSGLLYLVSSKVLVKDGVTKKREIASSEDINYTTVDVGTLLNRPYDDYYVLAYDFEDLQASYYASLVGSYDEDNSTMYALDLSLDINSKYVGDGNNSAKSIEELSLKSPTLIKVSKGKISKILDDLEKIEEEIK